MELEAKEQKVTFTKEEREGWITFCEKIAEELGIEHEDFNTLTDYELDKASDWCFELSLK